MKPRGWYIGWVGKDNLGDEALYEVCRERFSDVAWHVHLPDGPTAFPSAGGFVRRSSTDVGHLTRTIADEVRHWTRTRRLVEAAREQSQNALATVPTVLRRRLAGEVAILGGGTLLNHATFLRAYRHIKERVGRPVPVFGCGVANPGFWPGRRSGWTDQRKEWAQALADLPVVGVRGPLSRDLLLDAGISQTEMVGDAAILLHRPIDPAKEPKRDRSAAPLIGFNCGCNSGALWGSYETLLPTMVEAVRRLLVAGRRVELVSVWPEDLPACQAVLEQVRSFGDVTIAPVFTSHDVFLEHVTRYDAFVAIKLHAGILAAAANVPFVMLEYRPKCLDFSLSIDWGEFTLRTSDMQPDQIEELVDRLLAAPDAMRQRLSNNMDGLRGRFMRYCAQIAPLLESQV